MLPAHLLGRHVRGRSDHRTSFGADGDVLRRHEQLGDPKIEDLQPPIVGEEEVLRLQIAVDDPLRMRGGETVGKLARELERLGRHHRPAREHRAQRRALEQLADDIRLAILLANVVNGDDVRMVQRTGRARLLLEPAQRVLIVCASPEEFDRHLTVEFQVPRDDYPAHPAATQLPLDDEPLPELRDWIRLRSRFRGGQGRRLAQESAGLRLLGEQSKNLLGKRRIVGSHAGQKRGTPGGFLLPSLLKQRFDLAPALRSHGRCLHSSAATSSESSPTRLISGR